MPWRMRCRGQSTLSRRPPAQMRIMPLTPWTSSSWTKASFQGICCWLMAALISLMRCWDSAPIRVELAVDMPPMSRKTSRRKSPAEPMIQEACWASSSKPSLRALLRTVRASRGAMIQSRKLRLDRGVANMATSSRKYNPHSGRGLRMAADMTDPCKGLDGLPVTGRGSSFLDSMMPAALPEEKTARRMGLRQWASRLRPVPAHPHGERCGPALPEGRGRGHGRPRKAGDGPPDGVPGRSRAKRG